jgi:NADP-dependent 3-hydroxy acid dehydrogenase YdfG
MTPAGALREQVAIITGASQGIGRSIAIALAQHQTIVCMVGRDRRTLEAAARAADGATSIHLVEADLTIDGDVDKVFRFVRDEFGRVDILVYSAGLYSRGTIASASVDDLDRLYRANVRAPFLLTQTLLPLLTANQGQIVFINSSQGVNTTAAMGQYGATKHALKGIADSLRQEVNHDGVRVLTVYPGRTATPLMESIAKLEGKTYRPELLMQPEDIAAVVLSALMLPRTAEVTEINIRPMAKAP